MTSRPGKVAALLAATTLAGALTACEAFEMPMIDPPELYLEAPRTPSNLPRGDYKLTNGQGETLMEVNSLVPEQEHNATFPLDRLDGTINIVATKDGKEIYTQTVTHTSGTRVKLEWDIDSRRFLLIEDFAPKSPGSQAGGDGGGDGGH
jgi:hypothetical protein